MRSLSQWTGSTSGTGSSFYLSFHLYSKQNYNPQSQLSSAADQLLFRSLSGRHYLLPFTLLNTHISQLTPAVSNCYRTKIRMTYKQAQKKQTQMLTLQ